MNPGFRRGHKLILTRLGGIDQIRIDAGLNRLGTAQQQVAGWRPMIPTTAVFAEILFIGLEAGAWLALLLMAIFGKPVFDRGVLQGWEVLATFLIGVAAYGLGVIVDRAADTTYAAVRDSSWGARFVVRPFGKCPDFKEKPAGTGEMRMRVMGEDDGKARFVDYQRSRLRIARATAFNLFLLLPCGGVFLATRTDVGVWRLIAFEALAFTMFVASVWAAERIGDAFFDRLVEAYKLTVKVSKDATSKGGTSRVTTGEEPEAMHQMPQAGDVGIAQEEGKVCRRAAAVCYRIRRGHPQFLLVSTTGDVKRWTFPKGKIEEDESAQEAAQREAREEAGVDGTVDAEPFVAYEYPRGDEKKCEKIVVDAFLLLVTRRGRPAAKERRRLCGWYGERKAKARLACGRRERFQAEHEKVIDAAVSRIASRQELEIDRR